MNKKITFTLFIILLMFASFVYVDYFFMKQRNTYPKLSIKKELDEGSYVYYAIMYKVWYCKKTNTYTIGSYKDKNAICKKDYEYDENGFYTNKAGIKISKKDLSLISLYYDYEVINNMNSEEIVEDAVDVSYTYGKNQYKVIIDFSDYKIVSFPEFKLVEGEYNWEYTSDQYCLVEYEGSDYYAPYVLNKCGSATKIEYDEKWCKNYMSSILVFDEKINKLCEKE